MIMMMFLPEAINELVLCDAAPPNKPHMKLVPLESMDEFYLPLTAFDYSKAAKNSCQGLPNWL